MALTRQDVNLFHDQFLLSQEPIAVPATWSTHECGGWHLASHPSLPIVPLRLDDGTNAGVALGHLVDTDGRYVRGELQVPLSGGDSALTTTALEKLIYRHGGRYVVLVLLPGISRVYMDPIGSLATVWCSASRRVASTTSLLLHDEPDHAMFRRGGNDYPACMPNLYYPADLTAVPGIRRVMVNHYLDLRTLEQTRHHPLKPYEEVSAAGIPEIVAGIHLAIQRQIGAAVAECGGAYLALTAGKDSRTLLACARPFIDQTECITLRLPGAESRLDNDIDCATAVQLARHAGFGHRVLSMENNSEQASSDYRVRIGYSGTSGKASKFFLTPKKHLDSRRAWMTGHAGGVYKIAPERYRPFIANPSAYTLLKAVRLGKVKKLAEYPMVVAALQRWFEQLPDGPASDQYKLAQIEHRVGAWSSAHLYGMAPFRITVLPVAHRDVIDGFFRLPYDYRVATGLPRDLLQRAWPELLDLPFNDE